MNHILYPNTVLGSLLIIILIFIDYTRKHSTDKFQRMLFLAALGSAFLAIAADYAGAAVVHSGNAAAKPVIDTVMLIFQTMSYYIAFIFTDYFICGDIKKLKRIMGIFGVLMVIYTILLIINLLPLYSADTKAVNIQIREKYFIPELAVNCLPILLCIVDIIAASMNSKQLNFILLFFLCLFAGLGAVLDMLFNTTGLVWLCFTAAVLFLYFYIIRQDLKIDALTGIGNRYSFNEFIEKLSRRNFTGKVFRVSWAVVMIDMDHFKEINDKLGHLEGDNALRDMAKVIKGCIRRSDFAARYGGDEFVLAARAETNIEKLIARLRKDLDYHNETAGRPYKLDISYGYDIFTTGGNQTIDEFLTHIDTLMYDHKAHNRRVSDKIRK